MVFQGNPAVYNAAWITLRVSFGATLIASLIIVTMFTMTAVSGIDPRAREMVLTLGASPRRAAWTLFLEVRFGLVSALLASFGRVASEVGIAIMLGGNIEGYTRTLTTAIALESMKGEFGFGIALGLVLLVLIFLTALLSRYVQKL